METKNEEKKETMEMVGDIPLSKAVKISRGNAERLMESIAHLVEDYECRIVQDVIGLSSVHIRHKSTQGCSQTIIRVAMRFVFFIEPDGEGLRLKVHYSSRVR